MTREEAKNFLIGISYKLGNMAIEYLTEKDGEKMREAIKALEQEPVIDKLRAEILEYIDDLDIAYEICGVFDKYKAEREVQKCK